jgi:hypothetical protein
MDQGGKTELDPRLIYGSHMRLPRPRDVGLGRLISPGNEVGFDGLARFWDP